MDQVTTFNQWIMVGGQNGFIYLEHDNIGRVYRQTFEPTDWFSQWRYDKGQLFWEGEHVIYEVRENSSMPGFIEVQLVAHI